MINKLKYIGVLSIAMLALGNSNIAYSSAGFNQNSQTFLDNKITAKDPIKQLPPVGLSSKKSKPIVSKLPDRLPPITENEELPEATPIYGSYDPETGGVIVSHTPTLGTRLPPITENEELPEATPIYGSYDPETGGVIVSHTPTPGTRLPPLAEEAGPILSPDGTPFDPTVSTLGPITVSPTSAPAPFIPPKIANLDSKTIGVYSTGISAVRVKDGSNTPCTTSSWKTQ